MGAWRHLRHRLEAVVPRGHRFRFVARRAAASPATGIYAAHQQQEAALIEQALGTEPVEGNGVVTAEARRAPSEAGSGGA